jgi:hypothetical protein
MNRFARIIVLAVAATALLTGIAQAARPGTPAGLGYADPSDLNPIAVGTSPALISILTLPDGKFVINATVAVYNNDFANEPLVNCQLRHGVTFGGTILDIAEVKLAPSNPAGLTSAKLPLTGVIDRAGAAAGVNVHVTCSSNLPTIANYAQLNAVSVSSLTLQ